MNRRRNVLIFKSVVETSNGAAVARLVEALPNSAELRPLIRKQFARTVYDAKTKRDYWIVADDGHLACLMITGLEFEEVLRMRTLLDPRRNSSFALQDVVSHAATVTGGLAHLI